MRLRAEVPLIHRSAGTVQVGDTGLVFHNLTPDELAWLRRIDGVRSREEVLNDAPSERSRAFFAALQEAGALTDSDDIDDHFRMLTPSERMLLLPEYDVLALSYRSASASATIMRDRARMRVRVDGDGEVAATMRMALRSCGYSLTEHGATFVVLADRGHPDVVDDRGLVQADTPHLPIHTSSGRAHVGPLVVPGVSSCLRCADHHRSDADPEWQTVATQLAVRFRNCETRNPTLIHLAVGRALAMMTQWSDAVSLQGDTRHLLNTSVYFSSPGGQQLRVNRPPHPLCGCQWRQPGRAQTG